MRTIQGKIIEIPGAKLSEKKTFGKIFRKFGHMIIREVVLFLEILENAVPFATRGCRNFKPNVLVHDGKRPKSTVLTHRFHFVGFSLVYIERKDDSIFLDTL